MGWLRQKITIFAAALAASAFLMEASGMNDQLGVGPFEWVSIIPWWLAVPALGFIAVAFIVDGIEPTS